MALGLPCCGPGEVLQGRRLVKAVRARERADAAGRTP